MKALHICSLAFLGLVSCDPFPCTNEVQKVIISPDKSKKVVLFTRDCGATVDFNTQASILGFHDELPQNTGSAFILEGGSVEVSWIDNTSISVTLLNQPELFKQEADDNGISITYTSK